MAAELCIEQIPLEIIEELKAFFATCDGSDPDQCWEITDKGYRIRSFTDCISGLRISATTSRISLVIKDGIVPADYCAMHSCDNPPCCRPSHLSAGTYSDNMADMINKGRSHWRKLDRAQRIAKTTWLRRGIHPKGKIVVSPCGREWPSAAAAAEDIGLTRQAVAFRCRSGYDGWSYKE